MSAILPANALQSIQNPIQVNGKIAGNIGAVGNKDNYVPFKSLFEEAVNNVENLDTIKSADSYNLAIGDMDNLAEMMTNSERSQVALQLMVQLRNKVLDGYSEIMRMNV